MFAASLNLYWTPEMALAQRSGANVDVEYVAIRSISIHTTPFCSDCRKLKKFLKERDVDFREVSLADRMLYSWQSLLSNRKPPITVIAYSDGSRQRIFGFDKRLISTILGTTVNSPQDSFEISEFDVRSPVDTSPTYFEQRRSMPTSIEPTSTDSFDISQ